MYKHTFDSTILRSYDVRGIYGKTLTEKDAFMLGFFFGITVREKNPDKKNPVIVIGMDGRLSSPALEKKLNEGNDLFFTYEDCTAENFLEVKKLILEKIDLLVFSQFLKRISCKGVAFKITLKGGSSIW